MSQSRWAQGLTIAHPGRVSPQTARIVARFVAPVVRLLWRPTLSGVEHLPKDGPFLLVANHSAGVGLAEILSILVLYLAQVGTGRPLAGFALPLGFHVWPLSALHRLIGSIPSSYPAAADAFARGAGVLVFPGGDHESLKPLWDVHRVDFCGRVGFLRMAHAAQVPMVPLGIRGGHWTAPILVRSKLLANVLVAPRLLLGVKRWGISLLGLVGAVALGHWLPVDWPWRVLAIVLWLGSPLTFLPWMPATLRLRIGPPIAPEVLGDGSDAALAAALVHVQGAVQALVDR